MDESVDNPPENRLPPGVPEASLTDAIALSGYPLQGIVAEKLVDKFNIAEEWGYVDRDSGEHRSLDLYAHRALSVHGQIQPRLVLLLECKRSIHPYVFFKNVVERQIPTFPKIMGLKQISRQLFEDGTQRSRDVDPRTLLGLAELSFVYPGPPHCSAFSVAHLNGKKVALSGSDPFNSLILPLVKATDHVLSKGHASASATILYPTLVMSISVVDAPLVLVSSPTEPRKATLAPWVRVPRHEVHADRGNIDHFHYVVDVVHIAHFDKFISDHLTPFMEEFSARAQTQSEILMKGGSVGHLDKFNWKEIKPRS
jgi:hypothetical protein